MRYAKLILVTIVLVVVALFMSDLVHAQQQPVPRYTVSNEQNFLNWLNSTRARYGLPAVGYDQNLANWAMQNNAQQSRRGIGHFVMGPARRQNAAMGSASNIGSMWMASPAHRAALLDPNMRWIGLAGWGSWWTLNLR